MPELPEVEAFRWALLPLVANGKTSGLRLHMQRIKDNPPRSFISDDDIASLHDNCTVVGVERKGKLLCMILDCIEPVTIHGKEHARVYLYIHMGMTGRISTPGHVPALESLEASDEYPPPYTYITWSLVDGNGESLAEASFSDPRKFGSVVLTIDQTSFDELAPDALTLHNDGKVEGVVVALMGQSKPIKAILLDQKRVTSGVGNWIADELMYQCHMHPEQKFLTKEEAQALVDKLSYILKTAVEHLKEEKSFPEDWMFGYRWTLKRKEAKDAKGRSIAFVKVGGRSSAIVPDIQKLEPRGKAPKKQTTAVTKKHDKDNKEEQGSQKKKQIRKAAKRVPGATRGGDHGIEPEEKDEGPAGGERQARKPEQKIDSAMDEAVDNEEIEGKDEEPCKKRGTTRRPTKKRAAAKASPISNEDHEEGPAAVKKARNVSSKRILASKIDENDAPARKKKKARNSTKNNAKAGR